MHKKGQKPYMHDFLHYMRLQPENILLKFQNIMIKFLKSI